MPLKASGTVVGVLQLINKKSGPFDEDDEELLESFLSIAASHIKNSSVRENPRTMVSAT
eukprot:SAG31_NODE_5461_length_2523_cov_4.317244_1_plen_59_part_00